jgi:hypothetical protein
VFFISRQEETRILSNDNRQNFLGFALIPKGEKNSPTIFWALRFEIANYYCIFAHNTHKHYCVLS